MLNFTYFNPVRIHFGAGTIARLAEELPGDASVLLVCGGGSIRKNGVYDQIVAALGERKRTEFFGIEANPHYSTCLKAISAGRQAGVTHILAAGGGSVIDASKFIAAALRLPEGTDPWGLVTGEVPMAGALPIGTVVTLPASGSEGNSFAVITHDGKGEKRVFCHPALFPVFSILDPAVTDSLPSRQRINGIVDTWMHIMEQYLTFPSDSPVQDRLAEGLLLTLLREGPRSIENPADTAARANLMWAASLGLNGLVGAGVPQDWSTHFIGHELTTLFGLDHAQSLAVVHPALLTHCKETKQEKLLQLGERVFGLRGAANTAEAVIDAERAFLEKLRAPTRLSAYGLKEEQIPAVAANIAAVLHDMKLKGLGEHQTITPEDVKNILRLAL